MSLEISPGLDLTRKFRNIRRLRRKRRLKKLKKLSYKRHSFDVGSSVAKVKQTTNFIGSGMISSWYWSNYYKAQQWRDRHKVMLWKSYAMGLYHQNRYLSEILAKMSSKQDEDRPRSHQYKKNLSEKTFNKMNHMKNNSNFDNLETEYECKDSDSEKVAFEMSDEMIKFFEQSFKHKLELKKMKENKEEKIEEEVKELQEAHKERIREMQLLYGDGSSKIIGMETAVQLSYDKYCDLKSPKYWPNIPLNL